MITTLALALPLALPLAATTVTPLLPLGAPASGATGATVLVLGDSWAKGITPPLQALFEDAGMPGACEYVSLPAGTASGFLAPDLLDQVTAAVLANADAEYVYLSLGGNDFLATWSAAQAPLEAMATIDAIIEDLSAVVDHVRQLAPAATIVLPGYDYANFEETLVSLPDGLCASLWDLGMASPSTLQINLAVKELDARKRALAEAEGNALHIDLYGVLQTRYGYPSLGIPPGAPKLPSPSLPTPPEALAMEGSDCIHASEEGFAVLAQYVWASVFKAPYGLQQLTEAFPGSGGWFNSLSASGFAPGSTVTLFGGYGQDLKTLHGCPGFEVAVKNPMLVDQAQANASGVVDFLFWLPMDLVGTTVSLQAVATGGCVSTAATSTLVR